MTLQEPSSTPIPSRRAESGDLPLSEELAGKGCGSLVRLCRNRYWTTRRPEARGSSAEPPAQIHGVAMTLTTLMQGAPGADDLNDLSRHQQERRSTIPQCADSLVFPGMLFGSPLAGLALTMLVPMVILL